MNWPCARSPAHRGDQAGKGHRREQLKRLVERLASAGQMRAPGRRRKPPTRSARSRRTRPYVVSPRSAHPESGRRVRPSWSSRSSRREQREVTADIRRRRESTNRTRPAARYGRVHTHADAGVGRSRSGHRRDDSRAVLVEFAVRDGRTIRSVEGRHSFWRPVTE